MWTALINVVHFILADGSAGASLQIASQAPDLDEMTGEAASKSFLVRPHLVENGIQLEPIAR
jgi:hypothetical protein